MSDALHLLNTKHACQTLNGVQVILTALCGHGHFDLASYETYLSGNMEDIELDQDKLAKSLASIPVIS